MREKYPKDNYDPVRDEVEELLKKYPKLQNDPKYNKQIDKEILRDSNRLKDVHSRAYTTSPKNKPKFGRPRLLPTQKGIDAQNALFESIFGQHYPF